MAVALSAVIGAVPPSALCATSRHQGRKSTAKYRAALSTPSRAHVNRWGLGDASFVRMAARLAALQSGIWCFWTFES
jgi:hypothetical protein